MPTAAENVQTAKRAADDSFKAYCLSRDCLRDNRRAAAAWLKSAGELLESGEFAEGLQAAEMGSSLAETVVWAADQTETARLAYLAASQTLRDAEAAAEVENQTAKAYAAATAIGYRY